MLFIKQLLIVILQLMLILKDKLFKWLIIISLNIISRANIKLHQMFYKPLQLLNKCFREHFFFFSGEVTLTLNLMNHKCTIY